MNFGLYAYRFEFEALDTVHFARGSAANAFRGTFGRVLRAIACRPECNNARSCEWCAQCAYGRLFEPAWIDGPSGFAYAPRPFVIRASSLDGRTYPRGAVLPLDVHVFDLDETFLKYLVRAFLQLASEGIGAGRGRIALRSVHTLTAARNPGLCVYECGRGLLEGPQSLIELPLFSTANRQTQRLLLRFLTPTELKSEGQVLRSAPFDAVFARVRDRIRTIASLYGHSLEELEPNFNSMTSRAALVKTVSIDLRWIDARRRSGRTGQTHPLGGLVGEVRYEGEVGEFLPILEAAYWTGIGRQTVWGKGAVDASLIP